MTSLEMALRETHNMSKILCFCTKSGEKFMAVWNGLTPYATIYRTADGSRIETISSDWQEGDENDEREWQPPFSITDLESNGYQVVE